MVKRSLYLDLSTVFLIASIFVFSINFVSANFEGCWEYKNTNNAICVEQGGDGCFWVDASEDICFEDGGCCMDTNCGLWEGTSQATCAANDGTLNCTWEAGNFSWTDGNDIVHISNGTCYSNSFEDWGGYSEGCWQYDGDQNSCASQGSSCSWASNDQNQDPWCWIKSLSDAQNENLNATTNDIGCCETASCWQYDNNEASCSTSFNGTCYYENNTYGGGWCDVKPASELDEFQCNYTKQNLFMPYNWNGASCDDNGFGAFDGDFDSCFSTGGWYNETGGCVMPDDGFGGGGGGSLFFDGAKCWFADNQPQVCGNITGCAYCVAGSGVNGVANDTAGNICYNKMAGYCEGHDVGDQAVSYINANNSASLACTDIGVKAACKYGPLPTCKWDNISTEVGSYCIFGNGDKSAPPAQYCEDPAAKNNYSVCSELIEEFMMPCKWQNTTYPITNCTFNDQAVFGDDGDKDFEIINSQFSCTSAGGTWMTENYVDGGVLKQDSWCEMTGMFDIDQGQGQGNKFNCDSSCWACELQVNGTAWGDVAAAESACVESALAKCRWTNDTLGNAAFNGLGWCDYADNGDCNLDCESCNSMNDPQTACEGSMANDGTGCKWVSEGSENYCVDKSKKTCGSDCFSCFTLDSCRNSSLECAWSNSSNLCSPDGFTGEVCFDGIDNDGDTMIDCGDPDCGFDNFCGGNVFGGDCFAQLTEGTCNQTEAFEIDGVMANCTWLTDTWNEEGWCDMPGANCWKFDGDLVACGLTVGCTNDTTSMGSDAWCEMNWTNMDEANCWSANNESACGALSGDCSWKNDTWCASEQGQNDQWCIDNPNAGWCDYSPFAQCMGLDSTGCSSNANCTWQEDNYSMQGGWCDVACFDWNLNETQCGDAAGGSGLCEWRSMSETCQPSTFMMMGSIGVGGKTGCWQYDGNETGCALNSDTCIYQNDTYANNNLSGEPSGWCMGLAENQHFGDIEGDVVDLAMDTDNVMGMPESGVSDEVDIMGLGMRVTDEGFNFGAGVVNISDAILCNGYAVGNFEAGPFAQKIPGEGNSTTSFFWYLDTNGNSIDGCRAVQNSTSNLTGYDFLIKYTSRNTSSGISETKQLMRCSNSSTDTWSPTNAQVTTSKKLSCGEIGGVMVAVSSQDLEGFSEYDETAVMKVFISSANDTDSRTSPSDSVGPGYYTPGTIDFEFVDCSDPDILKNNPKGAEKCKNFQKFGFNVYEECKNGIDDDENGLVDCDDPFCSYMPECNDGTGFAFNSNSSDITSPVVTFSDVERLHDAAFLKVDTNEPSNMTLTFYKNDSTCKLLNVTVNDTASGYQANANFKPFHSIDLMQDTLGYALTNNTAYYYKVIVCDPSNNCAVSACLNFTTKTTAVDKTFIFKVDLPEGYTVDIPALNKTAYNFTEEFGGTWYDVGIKTNTSVTKNMNMTIHCGDMSIGFFGMNVLSPTNIDLTNAFVCDTVNNLMGMNSSLKKWNTLISDLHLGGAADYIEITIPVAYSASNTFNWTNDEGGLGQDVDDYVSCRDGGNSNTICSVPVSMGFSAYTVTTPAAAAPGDGGDAPGSGGGGGGAASNVTINVTNNETIVIADNTSIEDEEDNNDSTDKSVAEIANEKASKLYTSAKEFILENKKSVGIGIGVLVLVIAGIVGFVVYKKRKLSLS
jgi:hypothetical protein